jgi:hypothetical protein
VVLQPAGCRNAKHARSGAVRNKPGRLVFSISHHSSAKIEGQGYQKCREMGKLWEKLGSRGVTLLREVRRHGAAAWLRTSVKSWCSCCSAASLWSFSPVYSFHYPSPKFPRRSSRKSLLVVRTSLRSRLPCGKRVRWSSWGRRLNNLARSRYCRLSPDNGKTNLCRAVPTPSPERSGAAGLNRSQAVGPISAGVVPNEW